MDVYVYVYLDTYACNIYFYLLNVNVDSRFLILKFKSNVILTEKKKKKSFLLVCLTSI